MVTGAKKSTRHSRIVFPGSLMETVADVPCPDSCLPIEFALLEQILVLIDHRGGIPITKEKWRMVSLGIP
jgi:hypothetical protein